MIRRLEISGLVVIERADLDLAPGLVAITGETGAGKSVLMQSLSLLAGGPADGSLVRPGHTHALVQATLELPEGFWASLDADDPAAALEDLVDDPREVVVSRRIPAEGRARAFVDGQVAAAPAVGALMRHVVRFSGQGEQYQLVSPSVQMSILDAFAGPGCAADARRLASQRRELAEIDAQIATLATRVVTTQARRDALTALVEDGEELAGSPQEFASLKEQRERMRHADTLMSAAAEAIQAISPSEGGGARDLVGGARSAMEARLAHDPDLADLVQQLISAEAALEDLSIGLRSYADGVDADPARLQATEDRIDHYVRFCRRHGIDIDGFPDALEAARRELETTARELSDVELRERRERVVSEAVAVSDRLHTARMTAAARLSRALTDELDALAMSEAAVRIELTRSDEVVPVDRCAFWFRANPGLPESRLADAASGGELSRVLLAMHAVARSSSGATWVFDEIDAGIGGTTAPAVAARLAAMGEAMQVIVITHLPPVAAAASSHFRLLKTVATDITTTAVEPLEGDAVEDEIVRMLGGEAGGAREHARSLIVRGRGG